MQPYAELLEFNQPNPIRKEGFTRIRDSFDLAWKEQHPYGDLSGYVESEFYDPERISEFSGRWDYGSKNADKLGQPAKDGTPMIQKWINSGEQSMLEMGHATFFIECSRVVTHELVRHRLASYQQESQRFTKYDEESPEDLFYIPDGLPEQWRVEMMRQNASALENYRNARKQALSPQLARYVLPNAMRTRIIVSANMREWRHILKLRLHSSAQPEMREVMQQVYDQLIEVFPQSLSGLLDGERGVR